MARWKRANSPHAVEAVRRFGTLQSKLFELTAKKKARRALLQGKALQSAIERQRERLERFANKGKKK